MEVKLVKSFSQTSIDSLLSSIPFYRTVRDMDPYQYDLLINHSKVIEYGPGEVVLEKGQKDHWLYFLLKGQLEVRAGDVSAASAIVNYVTPGEVFGDLAVLFGQVRTASVVADASSKKAIVFGMDFSIFGKVEEFHHVSMATKLIYYRNMVHNLRWKLEVYRAAYPDQLFASDHRKIKLYNGAKDSLAELKSLYFQAKELARLLVKWNEAIERLALTSRAGLAPFSLRSLGNL